MDEETLAPYQTILPYIWYNTDLELHTLFFQKCARNYFFHKCSNIWQDIQTLEWHVQGGFEVSIHGDTQNPTRHSPEAEFCLSRGLGLRDMQRGFAASASLWFCDLFSVSELTVVIDLIWFHKVSFLMNSKVVLPLCFCDLSHRLKRWKQSWIVQPKINIQQRICLMDATMS